MSGINDTAAWSYSCCPWTATHWQHGTHRRAGDKQTLLPCKHWAGLGSNPWWEIQARLFHLWQTQSREHPHPCCSQLTHKAPFTCGTWNYPSSPQPRASGQALPVLLPLQSILGKTLQRLLHKHIPFAAPSLEYHYIKEKKANQKQMTLKRIFSASFADNRHRRTELLFAMLQEHPIPGAKPSCCWRQPISWAEAFPQNTAADSNSWQLMPAQAEVILPQILPLPLITQFLPWPCQGCADKERICNPVLPPQGFIFRCQIQQGKHRDWAVGRDNSVTNARCWSDMNVHYSTCLQQMAFEGAKNIIWEVWSWSALHIPLPNPAQLKIMS